MFIFNILCVWWEMETMQKRKTNAFNSDTWKYHITMCAVMNGDI